MTLSCLGVSLEVVAKRARLAFASSPNLRGGPAQRLGDLLTPERCPLREVVTRRGGRFGDRLEALACAARLAGDWAEPPRSAGRRRSRYWTPDDAQRDPARAGAAAPPSPAGWIAHASARAERPSTTAMSSSRWRPEPSSRDVDRLPIVVFWTPGTACTTQHPRGTLTNWALCRLRRGITAAPTALAGERLPRRRVRHSVERLPRAS